MRAVVHLLLSSALDSTFQWLSLSRFTCSCGLDLCILPPPSVDAHTRCRTTRVERQQHPKERQACFVLKQCLSRARRVAAAKAAAIQLAAAEAAKLAADAAAAGIASPVAGAPAFRSTN